MVEPIRIFSYSFSDFVFLRNLIEGYATINLFERLDLFVQVYSPEEAQFIVFPLSIDGFLENEQPNRSCLNFFQTLTYYKQYEAKHIFFSFHDYSDSLESNSIFFRASVRRSIATKTTFAFPYDVRDLGTELNKLQYHTSFVGATSTYPLRKELENVLSHSKNLQFYVNTVDTFYENISSNELKSERKQLFLQSVHQSFTICCPRGNGVQSKRFFEVLSMGRIPILISDDVLLPIENEIEYSKVILRLPEDSISQIERYLAPFFLVNNGEEILERFQYARKTWIDYLQPYKWGELIAYHLNKVIHQT